MSPMSKIIAQSKMKEKNNECGKELLCSKCRKRVLYHIFRRPAKTVIKDIEKRPLSKLLGVGELTITRYLDGQLPSVKYSNILFQVLRDEQKMKQYVESNSKEVSVVAVNKVKIILLCPYLYYYKIIFYNVIKENTLGGLYSGG